MTRPEPLPDQWYSRDLLVLMEVARRLSEDPTARVDSRHVAEAVGLDSQTVSAIGDSLKEAGFVDGIEVARSPALVLFTKLTPAGRRAVGLWPSPEAAAERLLTALDAAIARTPEGEQKTRLQKAREALGGMTRDLFVDLVGGAIRGELPLP